MARNHLLDLSEAEYIMYCDDDDEFTDTIDELLEAMEEDEADVYVSPFNEKNRRIITTGETIFIHGKAFRKRFLELNSIRWADELQVIEDVYFVSQCIFFGKIKRLERCFYRWNDNPNSTSASKHFVYDNINYAIRSKELLIDILLKRDMVAQAKATLSMIVETIWRMSNEYDDPINEINYFIQKYDWMFERHQTAIDIMAKEIDVEIKTEFNEWYKARLVGKP